MPRLLVGVGSLALTLSVFRPLITGQKNTRACPSMLRRHVRARSLANVLKTFSESVCNSWVDVFTDSLSLLHAWNKQGSRTPQLASAFKSIFWAIFQSNACLNVIHLPLSLNPADIPSRHLTLHDSKLAPNLWFLLQDLFGGESGHMELPCVARLHVPSVRCPQCSYPNDSSFLFCQMCGYQRQLTNPLHIQRANFNLSSLDSRLSALNASANSTPYAKQKSSLRAIENYIAMVHELGLDLSTGFLFRPTDHKGLVINTAFASSTAESRLRSYLNEGKINDGETLHSFRSDCAIPLALSGSSLIDVMSQVGWHRASTAHYYMKLAQVLRCDGPSSYLAATDPSQSSSADQYIDMNTLKQFLCAFPPTHTS
ncbi:Protein dispatched 1 [Desmophyllum pertusum]|uniref:Protein dispatched 1 n=1 Tax=Desmophyllum pertusum TaxID=174260 RepID=A0A9X0A7H2_9CNID|nr:Protein dispatched 1 [Desmophyllum pertusum]